MTSGHHTSNPHEHNVLGGAPNAHVDSTNSADEDQAMRIAMGVYAFARSERLQSTGVARNSSAPLHRALMLKFAQLDDVAVDGFSEMGRILLTENNIASSHQDLQPAASPATMDVAPLIDPSSGAVIGYVPVEGSGAAPQKNPYLPMIVGSVLFGVLAATGLLINEKYIQAIAVGGLFILLLPIAGAVGSYRMQGTKDGGLMDHIGEHIIHAILSSVIGLLSSKWLWFVFVILMGIAYAGYMTIVELPGLGAPSHGLAPEHIPGSNFPGVSNPAEGTR